MHELGKNSLPPKRGFSGFAEFRSPTWNYCPHSDLPFSASWTCSSPDIAVSTFPIDWQLILWSLFELSRMC